MNTMLSSTNTYSLVASEYYYADLHPTCANFRSCSERLLTYWLERIVQPHLTICEVGAGDSIVAQWMNAHALPLSPLTITDSEFQMLAYSRKWEAKGARLLTADASHLPFHNETFDVVVASLGDPYNTASTWFEFSRILRPGGFVAYSTPSYTWASQFRPREGCSDSIAVFERSCGDQVSLPSIIVPFDEQLAMIRQASLTIAGYSEAPRRLIKGHPVSAKILCMEDVEDAVVSSYLARKLK